MATPDCIIGIDPGTSGAIAWWANGEMTARKLDGLTEHDTREVLAHLASCQGVRAYIEIVGANRNRSKGEVRQGATAMFTFGRNYGLLRGLLVGLCIPFEDVRPVAWQRAIGIGVVKDEKSADKKRRHKAKAQQLWPHLKVTLQTCDALLICEYGVRRHLAPDSINESVE